MAKIFEKPRMQQVDQGGEVKLACCVLIDVSGSMSGYETEIERNVQALKTAIQNDPEARGRVEIELILFDSDVREASRFSLIDHLEIPKVTCSGGTSTHAAVKLALERVKQRKEDYKLAGVEYYQPWIWLFTDGDYTDPDNGSFKELLAAQQPGANGKASLTFYPIAVGDHVNELKLAAMHKDGLVMRVDKDNLGKAFAFLSRSLSLRSQRDPQEPNPRMQLPDGITAVVYNPL